MAGQYAQTINTQVRQVFIRRCLQTILTLLFGGLLVIGAQQPEQRSQEQRPRKVTTQASPSPSASPSVVKPPVDEGEEIDEGDVVRVETQLVSVPAIVTNRAGRPVPHLRAANFVVFENGIKQEIVNFGTTDAPFEIALLLDTSGSTRADVALIRRAANAFIDALRPGDRVAIVAFNTTLESGTSLATVDVTTGLTSDRAALRTALENVGTSNGHAGLGLA